MLFKAYVQKGEKLFLIFFISISLFFILLFSQKIKTFSSYVFSLIPFLDVKSLCLYCYSDYLVSPSPSFSISHMHAHTHDKYFHNIISCSLHCRIHKPLHMFYLNTFARTYDFFLVFTPILTTWNCQFN